MWSVAALFSFCYRGQTHSGFKPTTIVTIPACGHVTLQKSARGNLFLHVLRQALAWKCLNPCKRTKVTAESLVASFEVVVMSRRRSEFKNSNIQRVEREISPWNRSSVTGLYPEVTTGLTEVVKTAGKPIKNGYDRHQVTSDNLKAKAQNHMERLRPSGEEWVEKGRLYRRSDESR